MTMLPGRFGILSEVAILILSREVMCYLPNGRAKAT
jgi:hypothetical protein